MRKLNEIFSRERDAKVAQGLLLLLSNPTEPEPMRFFPVIRDALPHIEKLLPHDANPKDADYGFIFEALRTGGYVKFCDGSGREEMRLFDVGMAIQLTGEGKEFFRQNYES